MRVIYYHQEVARVRETKDKGKYEMMNDMVHPHPVIPKASDLLSPLLPAETPTISRAIEMADEIKAKYGIFVTANYLYEVWMNKGKGA